METIGFTRILRPGVVEVYTGRTDYRRESARQGYQAVGLFLKVQYSYDGRLSITGVEGPRANGDCWGSAGQCVDALARLQTLAPGWTAGDVQMLRAVWEKWHLNDMRAGCEHQRAARWEDRRIPVEELPESTTNRDERGILAIWVYPPDARSFPDPGNTHEDGLLTKPCPSCGYRYGSKWLREEVPGDVLDFLRGLPDADVMPAWV